MEKKEIIVLYPSTGDKSYDYGYFCGANEVMDIINNVPTIDAIPVEWLRKKMKTPCMTCANPFDYVLVAWQDEQKEQEAR